MAKPIPIDIAKYRLKNGLDADVLRVIGRGRNRQVVWRCPLDPQGNAPRYTKINLFRRLLEIR